MNSIILALSLIVVAAANGAAGNTIDQLFRNPKYLFYDANKVIKPGEKGIRNIKAALLSKISNKAVWNTPQTKKNINVNMFATERNKIERHVHKFNAVPHKNVTNRRITSEFVGKNELASGERSENQTFRLLDENYIRKIASPLVNKKESYGIASVLPTLEENKTVVQYNPKNIKELKKDRLKIFSGSSRENKYRELIREFYLNNHKNTADSILRKNITEAKNNNFLAQQNYNNSIEKSVLVGSKEKSKEEFFLQPISKMESRYSKSKNKMKGKVNSVHNIKKNGTVSLGMLSSILGQKKLEQLIKALINKRSNMKNFNGTSNMVTANDVKLILNEYLKKNVKKRDLNGLFNSNSLTEISKKDIFKRTSANKDADPFLNNIIDVLDSLPSNSGVSRRGLVDIGKSIGATIGKNILDITGNVVGKIIKEALKLSGPIFIGLVYNLLKKRNFLGMLVIYIGVILLGVVLAVVVGSGFIFMSTVFVYLLTPALNALFLKRLTPGAVAKGYVRFIEAYDDIVGIDKTIIAIADLLAKFSRLKK